MRRRTTNPLILVATVIALAIGAWWTNSERPAVESSAPPAPSRNLPAAHLAAPKPADAPPDRLAQLVPDRVERAELEKTLALIERGGPFPHKQDGSVFGNRERRLPQQPRGYYHEYTVRTPGAPTRGARRIVRGDGGELYYTRDHYRTFIRL